MLRRMVVERLRTRPLLWTARCCASAPSRWRRLSRSRGPLQTRGRSVAKAGHRAQGGRGRPVMVARGWIASGNDYVQQNGATTRRLGLRRLGRRSSKPGMGAGHQMNKASLFAALALLCTKTSLALWPSVGKRYYRPQKPRIEGSLIAQPRWHLPTRYMSRADFMAVDGRGPDTCEGVPSLASTGHPDCTRIFG